MSTPARSYTSNQPDSAHRGHGEKLTRKMHAAIAALMSHCSIADAAQSAGVSKTTLWRWLQKDEFRENLQTAQETVFEAALSSLKSSTTEAVICLRRNLNCGRPSVEVRAAASLLKYSLKGYGMFDLENRIATLDARIKAHDAAQRVLASLGKNSEV